MTIVREQSCNQSFHQPNFFAKCSKYPPTPAQRRGFYAFDFSSKNFCLWYISILLITAPSKIKILYSDSVCNATYDNGEWWYKALWLLNSQYHLHVNNIIFNMNYEHWICTLWMTIQMLHSWISVMGEMWEILNLWSVKRETPTSSNTGI